MMLLPTVQYRFGRADMWKLAEALYRRSWTRRLLTLAAFVALFLATLLYFMEGRWPTMRQWALVAREPLIVAGLVPLLLATLFGHYISVLIYVARFKQFALADRLITLAFREDEIEADVADKARSALPWGAFIERIEAPDRVFLKIARYEALTIPRRAFPDETAYRDALTLLRTKVPHGSR